MGRKRYGKARTSWTDRGVARFMRESRKCCPELAGIHAASRGARFEALEPIRQGVIRNFEKYGGSSRRLPPQMELTEFLGIRQSSISDVKKATGYAVSSDRKLARALESTHKCNGTLNLFADPEVATGQVHGKTIDPAKKTKKGFLEFMDDLFLEPPVSGEYHVIMDNHSIHKRHGRWLEKHTNVFFHYTPTSVSWLNMVEIWFGILTLKSLRSASFSSTQELGAYRKAFKKAYNETAQSFVW